MKRKTIILLLIVLMFASVLGGTSFAANYIPPTNPTGDTTVTVTKTLEGITNPVSVTFGYQVTAAEGNPAAVSGTLPLTASIVFNNAAPNEDDEVIGTTEVDFAGLSFPKVGDYKFIISEVSTTNSTLYPISNDKYYLYVSVRNGEGDTLVATVAQQGILTTDETQTKVDVVYPSPVNLTYITVEKRVTGNMADKTEYFKFKVNIEGGNTGDTYTIIGQDTNVTYNGSTFAAPTTYTVGQDNYVYLQHGQTATIGLYKNSIPQIPVNVKYSFVEQDASTYETYVDGSTTKSKTSAEKTTVLTAANNKTTFVNNKEEATFTGVVVTIAPYVAVVAIAALGIVVVKKSKRRD